MSLINNAMEYLHTNIYSPYNVGVLIVAGLLAFILDTEHASFYGQNKDFIISFFLGLFNIIVGLFLLVIHLLHMRYIF